MRSTYSEPRGSKYESVILLNRPQSAARENTVLGQSFQFGNNGEQSNVAPSKLTSSAKLRPSTSISTRSRSRTAAPEISDISRAKGKEREKTFGNPEETLDDEELEGDSLEEKKESQRRRSMFGRFSRSKKKEKEETHDDGLGVQGQQTKESQRRTSLLTRASNSNLNIFHKRSNKASNKKEKEDDEHDRKCCIILIFNIN